MKMFERMSHIVSDDSGDPVTILMLASMLREDVPWLYEIGTEAYRASRAGDALAMEEALERFLRAAKFTTRGAWMEDTEISMNEMDEVIKDLTGLIERMRERWVARARQIGGKSTQGKDQNS
jgi:hypothetical protein